MDSYQTPPVRYSVTGGVARITLDRPETRNALSASVIDELLAGVARAIADPAVRVVLLSHTGTVFSSGADLKETAATLAGGGMPAARLGDLLAAVCECPKPVVARVAGPARAGGVGLVAAADLAVCATDATFAFSEVRIGVIPAVISATVLPRLSGRAAAELFLTGAVFDGVRAAEIGLVNAAVPAAELDATVDGYIADLLRGAPGALAGTKALLRDVTTMRDELAQLTDLSLAYFTSAEGREGVQAFREKRDPGWITQL
jgi:methylglutaconyl-CoA hydratase